MYHLGENAGLLNYFSCPENRSVEPPGFVRLLADPFES
jgi:hypothetical protein